MYIKKSIKCLFNEDKDCVYCETCFPKQSKSYIHPNCSCAISTDQYHGWECSVTGWSCMFLIPNSKQCAEKYEERPDL
jgi:hypothetical protein